MPNRNYVKGRRLEYAVLRALRSRGWTAVRTAGSHGWADVIAWKTGRPTLVVQCKSFRTTASELEKYADAVRDDAATGYRVFCVVDVPARGKKRWLVLTPDGWVETSPSRMGL